MSNKKLIQNINKELENKSTQEVIEYFLTKISSGINIEYLSLCIAFVNFSIGSQPC